MLHKREFVMSTINILNIKMIKYTNTVREKIKNSQRPTEK